MTVYRRNITNFSLNALCSHVLLYKIIEAAFSYNRNIVFNCKIASVQVIAY